jgi:hypothetical protein
MTTPPTAEHDELVERLRKAETHCGALSDVNHLFAEAATAITELSAQVERMRWQSIETAPKDGTRILAITGEIEDERWNYLSHREFVVWHLGHTEASGLDMGWSLYPGMGVGDAWLAAWQPLPEPPAALSSDQRSNYPHE